MSDLYIEKKFYKNTHFKINVRLMYDILWKKVLSMVSIKYKYVIGKSMDNF